MPNSYLLQKLMLRLLLISGEQNYPKYKNTQISPSKTAFQDSVIRAVQNPDSTVSDIFTDKFKENRKFLCSQSPAYEFFSADLPQCREILYLHHQLLKCSKKGDLVMAGLHKTILKPPLGTRVLQGLLSQCLSSARPVLYPAGPVALTELPAPLSVAGASPHPRAPSLPFELFSEKPLARAMALSPLKAAHPGLEQSPLEAHPTTAVFFSSPPMKYACAIHAAEHAIG